MTLDNVVEYVLYLERKVQRLEQIIQELRGSIDDPDRVGHRDKSLPLDHLPSSNE